MHIIIGALLIWKTSGFFFFFGIAFTAIGIFYFLLRKIEFDEAFIYVGANKFTFQKVEKISGLEINMYFFPLLKIDDNGRKKWFFTDSGQAGLLRILIGIIFPALDPMKNMKKFTAFHAASRS